jgi:hypothetical protein
MKKIISLLIITTFLACCNKDDNPTPTNPVDQLPPATQTGANTFGCLLDGQVFKPGLTNNSLDCVYQFIDNEYYFSLQGNKRDTNNNIILVGLSTKAKQIEQNNTYQLLENIIGNAYGTYAYATIFTYTNQINSGELKITKLDFTNNIVSGTFWYDIKDSQNVVHQVRDGRFDMQFTQ